MPALNPVLQQLGLQVLQMILPALGTALGSLAAWALYKVIGLIKNKKLQDDVFAAVSYAEAKLSGDQAKLAYVTAFIKSKVGNSLSDQEIAHLVEAAVLAMQNATPSAPAPVPSPAPSASPAEPAK